MTVALVSAACGGGEGDDEADATADPAETYEINVGHVLSTDEAIHQELVATAERVAQRTDGQVVLELFPDSQLGSNQDLAEQATSGSNVIGHVDPGYASEHVPDMAILGGPFLFDDVDDIEALLGSDLFMSWREQLEEAGLVSLAWNWYFGERHLIADVPAPSPEDLRGVSVRVSPNPVWVTTFDVLPSSPVQLEWSEVYSGLQQGVIDAAEAPLSTLAGSSLQEVADTITLTGHFKAVTGFVVGRDYWETLPGDLRDIVAEEFAAGGANVTQATIDNAERIRGELEEEGVTFVDADVDTYTESVQPFYDAFPEWSEGLYEQVIEAIAGS